MHVGANILIYHSKYPYRPTVMRRQTIMIHI